MRRLTGALPAPILPSMKPITLRCLSLVLLLSAAAGARAVEPLDPITRMLVDRGLLDPFEAASGHASATLQPLAPPVARGRTTVQRPDASGMVVGALNFLDIPYRWGGKNFDGFDCSGFTQYVFRQAGFALPPSADEQARAPGLASVEPGELKPGDLVFFNTLQRTYSHVGIYVGNQRFIHSPRTGSQVRVEDMGKSYWASRFTGARRVGSWAEPVAAIR